MWLPSTSASVMMMILWYLSFSASNSSPIPQPSAVIIFFISSDFKILSSLAFSTFRILPLSGNIAWKTLSRPCFAEPPAESPSTRYSSLITGSLLWQSASLPGSVPTLMLSFLRVRSLAFLAASLPRAAIRALSIIALASIGFSSKYFVSTSKTIFWTIGFT